jgi:hypothetical protein
MTNCQHKWSTLTTALNVERDTCALCGTAWVDTVTPKQIAQWFYELRNIFAPPREQKRIVLA